ncbi:MAG: ATP-binding protein [Campylobacterales bacterium]|nr:ATP-binding protein [Campylobacterales bacterium]
MKTLESCYELSFSKINFIERKIRITKSNTILKGPPKSGKSFLIYDYLSAHEEEDYLYIDLNNFKNKNFDTNNLDKFIKDKKIKILVLENYNFDFDLPLCSSIIITSYKNNKIEDYEELRLMPLDFEEYLLHDNKHQQTTASFNQFLKYGNLAELIQIDDFIKEQRLQDILKLYSSNETHLEILKLLFSNIDEKKSIFQLFTVMKKDFKISKDKFYEMCKVFEDNYLIFFLQKYKQEKASKKLYSYNHAFLPAISHNKKFKNEFSNMIFLELINKYTNIYYLDNIDFYIEDTNTAILSIPFFNPFLVNTIKKKLETSLKKQTFDEIYIITIGTVDSFECENKQIQVLPFYEWAVL